MEIVYEESDGDYEQCQALLLRELVSAIRRRVDEAGIKGRRLRDVVEAIAFDVGAIIDGSQVVSSEEDHLVPILGFAEGRMRDQLRLSHSGADLHYMSLCRARPMKNSMPLSAEAVSLNGHLLSLAGDCFRAVR